VHALFWLVFKRPKEVVVIIQPAGDIITARMRAMLAGMEGAFQEGHELDAKTAKKVPKPHIGKLLSRAQATALLKKLGK
jgi:type II secretory pathway component PulM